MRPVLVATLCALVAVPALGQTNPPGYMPFDLAQQAKLRGHVGTWQCVSVPAANPPLSFTETEQGNWFVTVSYTHLDVYKRQPSTCDCGRRRR